MSDEETTSTDEPTCDCPVGSGEGAWREAHDPSCATQTPTEPEPEPQGPIDLPAPPIPEEYQRRMPPVGDILYAWQMQVENGWNIIGMAVPGGQFMPIVTTSMPLAWEAFEIAQAHANRNACQVRLATFRFDSLAAVVEPND